MKIMIWLGVFFIILGVLSLGIGAISYRNEQALLATYSPATATVSEWIPDPNYGTPDYCPVYDYTTSAGESRSFTGNDCEARPDPKTVGHQQKLIYYDPTNPYTSVETPGWSGSQGTPLIAGAIGFGFFSLLGLVMILMRNFGQKTAAVSQGKNAERSSAFQQSRQDAEDAAAKAIEARERLEKVSAELKARMEERQRKSK
jgi:hypothetical protein